MDEQLREAVEELNRTLNGLGSTTSDARKKFQQAGDQFFKTKGAGEQLEKSFDALGSATKKLTSSIYQGKATISDYAEAMTSGAEAIGDFVGKFGIWGRIIGTGIGLMGQYFGAAAKQADKLYKGFQGLSQVGAGTADGIMAVREALRDFRLGIDDTDKLVQMIGENASNLALFGTNIAKGAKSVGQMTRGIVGHDGVLEQFMNMGETVDTINQSAFAFASNQARTGGMMVRTQEETTEALKKYIEQQNIITKITGATAKQQQEAQARAMNIEQFRYKINKLRASQDAASVAEADRLLEVVSHLRAIDPSGTLEEMFAVLQTGIVAPGTGVKAMIASSGEAARIAVATNMTATQQAAALAEAIGKSTDPNSALGGLAAVGKYGEIAGAGYGAMSDVRDRAKDYAKRMAEAKDETERQKIATEMLTSRMTKTNIATLNARDNMQDFVEMGVNPATAALQKLADVVDSLTSMIPGVGRPSQPTVASDVARRNAAAQGRGTIGQLAAGMVAETKAMLGGRPAGTLGAIRELIAGVESRGNYNVLVGGQTADLTNMTLQQVYDLQQNLINSGKNSSAGKYQFNRATLMEYAAKLGMDPATTKFSASVQDKLADALIKNQGYDKYVAGQMSKEEFLGRLSQRWAGLPKDASGASYWKGTGNNKAGIGYKEALASLQIGGVVSGPKSGFMAQLHGTEAVVPLPDGRTIPVTMPDFSDSMRQQISVMGVQIAKLDEIVSLMRNQNNISTKILHYSQN